MSDEQTATEIDSREFRSALGRFATGITVTTTVVDSQVYGMTANAFMSVSLDPPLVLVSVDKRAHMHRHLAQSGRYAVSVLSEEQMDYSQHFAGFPVDDLEPEFVWVNDMPLLADTLAHLIARVVDIHPAGDHTLYIGQVEYLQYWDGEPLLYYQGQYAHKK